ncbi:MAG: hypothetical protein FJ404_14565 [Verrucomicrobia bacterium]|nr:hypothetical protein [Verrucomicrobiota bacterium]
MFAAVAFLIQLFMLRQNRWFGRELVNPMAFGALPLSSADSAKTPPDSFAVRFLPEFLTLREAYRRGAFWSRCLPCLGVLLGSVVLAIAASRELERAATVLLFALLSAHGACMLTIGLVPVSLRRQITENYALFIPGKRKHLNFISFGFFAYFNLITVWMMSRDIPFVPAASGVLGGWSLAALVMLLTLRSIRQSAHVQA